MYRSGLRFFTISQITGYLREIVDADPLLQDLWLTGEVSNYSRSKAGHIYFTLKDANAQLRCVLWRLQAARLAYLPNQGEAVLAHGYISIYEAGGNYQFYIDEIEPVGIGRLYIAFEALKARLSEEGLFAVERKRPLPPFPRCLGLVTSPTGAALRDILNVLGRRYPLVRVILAPTLVQGAEAPEQIVAALKALEARPEVEVIIVARGGGSLEDLWAFNDERVARAIYAARVPVICGVGHETDYTIADFVADARAPTPSAAAEIAVPDQSALREKTTAYRARLAQWIQGSLRARRSALAHAQQALAYRSPQGVLVQYRQRLDERLQRAATRMRHLIAWQQEQVRHRITRLQSLHPLAPLERGYAIVRRSDTGAIVRRVQQVAAGNRIKVQVSNGSFPATVEPEGRTA